MNFTVDRIEIDHLDLLATGWIFTGNASTEILLREPLPLREKILEIIKDEEKDGYAILRVDLGIKKQRSQENYVLVKERDIKGGPDKPIYRYRFYLGSGSYFKYTDWPSYLTEAKIYILKTHRQRNESDGILFPSTYIKSSWTFSYTDEHSKINAKRSILFNG